MKQVAVFDIDGVLADVRHRLHFVESRPKQWSAFFAAADGDGLLEEGAALLGAMGESHEIRYLTGRPERLRAVTEDWLARFELPAASLSMRPASDHRPSRIFKRERLQAWLGEGADIAIVVDDDPQVVAMVESIGLTVLAATWQETVQDQQQVLWEAQERLGRT